MTNANEQKFYEALNDVFTGEDIKGNGGFVNLLAIKHAYYRKMLAEFENLVNKNEILRNDNAREDFFNHLYSFFSRYFSESGSVYYCKTAYADKKYERVYTDNKDVILFWKTNMLYYVKSDIMYKNIVVSVEDNGQKIRFAFDCSEITGKQNNEKKEVLFEYSGYEIPNFIEEEREKCHILKVSYSIKGRKTKQEEIAKESGISEEAIKKAINVFNKQSSVDFFINKNAKKFLTEQLDLYIHQVLLDEQNEFDSSALQRFKIFKDFALKLIDFISQFEQELVRIWNKPKFVLNSNYVITLDRLPKEIIDKIATGSGLEKQIEEWQTLGIVDGNFDFNSRNNEEKYAHLPIDTKYFKDIEEEILALFDNLDEALDGRLIHSENYQALNTLKERYKGQVQCIYIDPPFNTGKDFAYIDGYQDSTWLTLMQERLYISKEFIGNSGSFFLHLDENADYFGRILLCKLGFDSLKKITFNTNATKDEESDLFGYKSFGNNFALKSQTIYFANNKESLFNKLWKPNRNMTKLDIGWLDLIACPKIENPKKIQDFKFFIEKYVGKKLELQEIDVSGEKLFPISDIWNDIFSFTQSEMRVSESVSFPNTQKPENLLRRIIQSTTNQKGTILDYFAGSGTTTVAAQKLNRKWIGVEMGEHIKETYFNEEGQIRLGLLGRLKITVFGDKKYKCIDQDKGEKERFRHPHLSKDLNWQGGGFFKYYALEQYESTLSKMKYSEISPVFYKENPFENYVFLTDSKLADVLEFNGKDVSLDFNRLYENIDFAETISLLKGLPIKKILGKKVILSDNTEYSYDFAAMNNEEKIKFAQMLKPLLWWGE